MAADIGKIMVAGIALQLDRISLTKFIIHVPVCDT